MSVAEAVGASWAESCWPRVLKPESTDTPGGVGHCCGAPLLIAQVLPCPDASCALANLHTQSLLIVDHAAGLMSLTDVSQQYIGLTSDVRHPCG